MSETVTIGSFKIEPLKGHENWLAWKRRILGIFEELDLETHLEEDAAPLKPKVENAPDENEKKEIKQWTKKDKKAMTRLTLAITNSELVYTSGAKTAQEMWKQLCTVYESRGRLGMLAARQALYSVE